jgi:hypothetical protein
MDQEFDIHTPLSFIDKLPESVRNGFSRYFEQKNDKLSPEDFLKVLGEVKKEKNKFVPKGSAQTTLPNLVNVESEIKHARNKHKEFNEEIDRVISKLNFAPVIEENSSKSPRRNKDKIHPIGLIRSDNSKLSPNKRANYVPTILITSSTPSPTQFRNRSGDLKMKLENAYTRSRRLHNSNRSHIMISCTPEPTLTPDKGLSPNPQNLSFDNSVNNKRTSRLKQFSTVVEKCESLKPTIRSQLPELHIKHQISSKNRKEVMRDICDLEECLSVAKDMESLQDMMAIKKYNKRAELEMLSTIREMMEGKSGHRIHGDKFKRHKIWKYSIGGLLKRTERLLYSIPRS